MTYIATISGGKDSVTMCDLLLKNNYPVDYIVFNDTLLEFDEMYQYIEKIKAYFKKKYNKEITTIKPDKTFEDIIFRKKIRGKREGMVSGLLNASAGYCEWRRDGKIRPFEKWIKEKGFKNYKIYIGITTDEIHRTNRKDDKNIYPLIDDFKMSENDCKQYLIDEDMENPLYKDFNRTGCAICPYQSKKDFYIIYTKYSKQWEYMKKLENEVNKLDNVITKNWFVGYKTTSDLEVEFKLMQNSLFDFSDEPVKDCFCKI